MRARQENAASANWIGRPHEKKSGDQLLTRFSSNGIKRTGLFFYRSLF